MKAKHNHRPRKSTNKLVDHHPSRYHNYQTHQKSKDSSNLLKNNKNSPNVTSKIIECEKNRKQKTKILANNLEKTASKGEAEAKRKQTNITSYIFLLSEFKS